MLLPPHSAVQRLLLHQLRLPQHELVWLAVQMQLQPA